jgi:glucuronoarabinoxylan endo-1,4-beta-xylanase
MGAAALAVPGGTVFCSGRQQSSNQALPEKGRKEGTLPAYSHVFWTQSQQQIDGFGISGAFHQAHNLMSYPKSDVTKVLNLLFSQTSGAGFSIVRNIVGDGGSWGKETDGPTPSIEPREGVWDWTGDEDQIWFMNEAKARGCTRFMSTVWSPPAWMKTNRSVVNGGSLAVEKYQAFADYLSTYVRGYKQFHNIDIYAISPTNEPDWQTSYSSCVWTGEQLRDFLKYFLMPTFRPDNVTARVIIGEGSLWREDYFLPSLNDPVAVNGVDVVAAHAYGRTPESFPPLSERTGRFDTALKQKKPIWQTEVCAGVPNDTAIGDGLYWAKLMHRHLCENQVSAWCYWWGMSCYNNRSALVYMDLAEKNLTVAKRLFAIGNYSRFIRPGYFRVDAHANPVHGVYVSAYRDASSSQLVIVVINENSTSNEVGFHIGDFKASVTQPYRTSATEDLAPLPEIPIVNSVIQAKLLGNSINTFVVGGFVRTP